VTANGTTQLREVKAGRSHNGMGSTLIQHFGLSIAATVDTVTVRWPSGTTQSHGPLEPDGLYRIVEGAQDVESLAWTP